MNFEKDYKKETGLNRYNEEDCKYTQQYVIWLEKKIEQLILHGVVGQSEQLVCEHKYQDNICDRRGVRKCMLCGKLEKTN